MPSPNSSSEAKVTDRKSRHKRKLKKSSFDPSSDESRERKYHREKGEENPSKSSDTNSESETGKCRFRGQSSSSYDMEDEAKEKGN